MNAPADIKPLLAELAAGRILTRSQAHAAFDCVMSGAAGDAQIGALLGMLAVRPGGPTVDEITGAAEAMRDKVRRIEVPAEFDVVDTCGTGGDASGTFNISTTAALIAAGAGARVVKHGNRSVTSRSGSSQVLEALGVKLDVADDTLINCLREANICFAFAPAHHPAMKHAIGPRRELAFRTIFNLLGPLTNPAGARRQVIGVFRSDLTEPIAGVLQQLGAVHAMVVHGSTLGAADTTEGGGGLDEITTTGPTRITTLQNGDITTTDLRPADLGLPLASIADLKVDSVEASAAVIRDVLTGRDCPARHIAALNAAAALVVADRAPDLPAALKLACESLDTAAAAAALERLIKLTNA